MLQRGHYRRVCHLLSRSSDSAVDYPDQNQRDQNDRDYDGSFHFLDILQSCSN